MGSCYIYQPQYLGAALSRTNGLPIGDAITGSVGGGARVLIGDGELARSTSPGYCPPPPAPTTRTDVLQTAVMECAPDSSSLPH